MKDKIIILKDPVLVEKENKENDTAKKCGIKITEHKEGEIIELKGEGND